MKIYPKGPRVLLQLDKEETHSKGGLLLPETRSRMGNKVVGTIEALGTKDCEDLREGDRVMLDAFAGNEVPGDPSRIITHVQNLLAIV